MTHRERLIARAQRLREWADKREQKSNAAYAAADSIASNIPFGQPILVGHHSERRHRRDLARIDNNMRASIEHSEKAASMRSRADNIEAAAANAIYSDDPDAIERLEAKIARAEARRDAIKAYNATCRKGKPDLSLLPPDLHVMATSQDRFYSALRGRHGTISPMNPNINRWKKRLEHLRRARS